MAGFFPDVPGMRFQYEHDGSVLMYQSGGPQTASVAQMRALNGEDNNDAFTMDGVIAVAWPEHRSVAGVYAAMGPFGLDSSVVVTKSTDTTNGVDGSWTALTTIPIDKIGGGSPLVAERCRSAINVVTASGVKGLKFQYDNFTNQWKALHIYGQVPTTENPDKLILCDASGAVVTNGAYFDFGDSARGTTATKTFRIKNNSSVLTANSVTVSFETLSDASPTLNGQFDLDFGAGAVTSKNIGNLAPGAMTAPITLRRNTNGGAAIGPWQTRVLAVPASMT